MPEPVRRMAAAALAAAMALPAIALAAASAQALDEERREELAYMVRHDCGSCHGMTMQGGLGKPLVPERLSDIPDEALVQAILDGRPGTPMPPWRGLISEAEAAWIVSYLKGDVE